jgi:hypothetical protein
MLGRDLPIPGVVFLHNKESNEHSYANDAFSIQRLYPVKCFFDSSISLNKSCSKDDVYAAVFLEF